MRSKEKQRLLIVTTVDSTVSAFLIPYIVRLRETGWIVDLASTSRNGFDSVSRYFDHIYDAGFTRKGLSLVQHIISFIKIRRILIAHQYDVVHTHTPISSFLCRTSRATSSEIKNTKFVYTAHGFHFQEGDNPIANLVFRTMEKIAGFFTDYLIVINEEDYRAAMQYSIVSEGKLLYTPGIGVDCTILNGVNNKSEVRDELRAKLRFENNKKIVLVVAEFIRRKKHIDVIRAIKSLGRKDIVFVFLGDGPLRVSIESLCHEWGIYDSTRFLGFQKNVDQFYRCSDCLILPSSREGLPRAILEAMVAGIPVIASDIRGTRDLLGGGAGMLYEMGNVSELAETINVLLDNDELRRRLVEKSRNRVLNYDINRLVEWYTKFCEDLKDGIKPDLKWFIPDGTAGKRVMVVGGVARSLVNFRLRLLENLVSGGYEVIACAGDESKEVSSKLKSIGVRYRVSAFHPSKVRPVGDLVYLVKLVRLIRHLKVRTIICYTHKPVIYSSAAAAIVGGKIYVYGMITGLGSVLKAEKGASFGTHIAAFLLRRMYGVIIGRMSGIIFQNSDDELFFREVLVGCRSINSVVVSGSGVDLSMYAFRTPKLGHRICFVSRVFEEKGILDYINAAETCKNWNLDAEFDVIGPVDSHASKAVKVAMNIAIRKGFIRYLGEVRDVRGVLEQYDIHVLPTYYREGVPRTILEAMAIGMPVITTSSVGSKETIRAPKPFQDSRILIGDNGFLVPVKDGRSIAICIAYLLRNKEIAKKMAVAGRAYVEDRFDDNEVSLEVLKFCGLAG